MTEDWQERYGLKPVLIETFVDRSTQTRKSQYFHGRPCP
jgi:hypothetical protein